MLKLTINNLIDKQAPFTWSHAFYYLWSYEDVFSIKMLIFLEEVIQTLVENIL